MSNLLEDKNESTSQRVLAIKDFAELVSQMNRFLVALASMPSFKSVKLGIAEWLALSVLAEADGISNKQLAKRLGVSGQRANQITTSLSRAELLSISPSIEDGRRVQLCVTPLGKRRLFALVQELEPSLARGLAGEERTVVRVLKGVKRMNSLLHPQSKSHDSTSIADPH